MTGITDLTATNFLGLIFDQAMSGQGKLAALPAEIAFQPVTVMRNYLLAMAVVLTLLAAFIIHWVMRRMFAPLDEAGRRIVAKMLELSQNLSRILGASYVADKKIIP